MLVGKLGCAGVADYGRVLIRERVQLVHDIRTGRVHWKEEFEMISV